MSNFNKPTNPPAFPSSVDDGETVKYMLGMSVRDYFAAKAMQTYMADQELIDMYCYLEKDVKQELATAAYMMADAMLKARKESLNMEDDE